MIIGVISDTHKENIFIQKAMEKLKYVDKLIHLGDNSQDVEEIKKYYNGEIINVRGNCDFTRSVPSEQLLDIDGKRVLICHGDKYRVKEDISTLCYKALEIQADLVLYGHTHISKIDFIQGIYFVNPGSTSLPKNGINTVATVEISQLGIVPSIIKL